MSRFSLFGSVLSLFLIASVSSFLAQTRKPATGGSDFKVTYRTTTANGSSAGQNSESTTMIKGSRERSEQKMGHGYDLVTITQCDLKQTIQVSDAAKKYLITPMETGEAAAKTTPTPAPPPTSIPTRRGGVVDYTSSSIDTGERKEMFGFTARHVKTVTTIQSSPDACSPVNQRLELDGWYIDLNVGFDCQMNKPPSGMNGMPPRGGCQDQRRFRREGTGKVGFPLIETMRMTNANGQVIFSTSKEVVDLSRQPLDSALFEPPAGYTQAASQQELFAMPSMADMMSGRTQAGNEQSPSAVTSGSQTKNAGAIKIGVAQVNNKAGKSISLDSLRARLMGQLENAGFEPVALNGSSQMEADAEAKAKGCKFILLTDLATLKSSKLGGMFGRVPGLDSGGAKTETKLEFKLFAVGESAPVFQSSASAKENSEEASTSAAAETEVRLVIPEVRKRSRG